MEKILIAVDLEGVNKVVGYPYKGLGDGEEYEISKNEAVNEINIIVKELFKQGVKPETKLFTFPETVEIRFTRTERADEVKTALKDKFGLLACYKNDAHTLTLTVNGYSELKEFLGQI